MVLADNVIGVKGRFVKETRGYRESDVQNAIRKIDRKDMDNFINCDGEFNHFEFKEWLRKEVFGEKLL